MKTKISLVAFSLKKKKKLKIVGKDYEHIGEKSCFIFSYARIKCQLG